MTIPPELAARLSVFERRLRGMETATAVLTALAVSLATLAVLAMLDRLTDVGSGARQVLTSGAGLAALGAAGWWLYRWLWRRRDARALARMVQRRYPQLGDRLLSAVELTRADADVAGMSSALLRAALAQVAQDAARCDFRRAVSGRTAHRLGIVTLLVAAGLAFGYALAPEALTRSLLRWLRPATPVERYTFAQWSELPREHVVPLGEPFEIEFGLARDARWRPTRMRARLGERPPMRARFLDGRALFRFPGLMQAATLTARAGDASHRMRIRPQPRPELIALTAHIEWPAYMEREPEQRRVESAPLVLPAGARLSFQGETGSRLSHAHRLPDNPLHIESRTFRTPERTVEEWTNSTDGRATNAVALVFSWSDSDGLSAAQPYEARLRWQPDAPPVAELEGAPRTLAALRDETLVFATRGSDDYGLAVLGMEWEIETTPAEPDAVAVKRADGEWRLREDATGQATGMEAEARVGLRLLDVRPGETLTVRAWALDRFPDRARARSAPIRIHVLSDEAHAQQVRRAFAELGTRLEDALREEERLLAAHEALEALDDSALALERAEAMLRRGEEAERANRANVEQIAQNAETLAMEALRNPTLTPRDIQPWLAAAEQLRQTATDEMGPAAEALARAQAEADTDARRAELQEALARERRAAEALRQALQETNTALDHTLARSFVNRLRETARMERAVADTARRYLQGMAGLPPQELDPAQQSALAEPLREHGLARREAAHIRDDLGAFFLRTRQPEYREVREAMREPDVLLAMDGVGAHLQRNQLALSADGAERMAEQFEAWADRLDTQDDAADSGAGDGGGEGEGLERDVLLGLMRARVWEEMVREQTRSTAEDSAAPAHVATRQRARERQHEISAALAELADQTKQPPAAQFLRQLTGISDEAVGLMAQPEDSAAAIAAQTEIIEAIAAALQGSSASDAAGEDAAGEQQMAALMAGEQPGDGSGQGGPSVAVGQHDGPGSGSHESRAPERAGGDPAAWPAEYLDAIQRYGEAMEQI